MVQGLNNPDGEYLKPVDVDTLGFPTVELPFLRNDTQFADAFNVCIQCLNALRLCGTVSVPTALGNNNPSGTYPRPRQMSEVNFPTSPMPYFGNHHQQARIFNFLVDLINSLRRCYISGAPTAQGTSIDGGTYLPPPTIASFGFPDNPIPASVYLANHVRGATLFNYLFDAINLLRNCCTTSYLGNCANMDSGSSHVSALSALRLRGDDFGGWSTGTAQYDAFVASTETDSDYENGIPDSPVNSPSPAEFDDYNFDWDTNAVGTRRSIVSQVNWNGGHRSIKSIKTSADPYYQQHFFEIIVNGKIGGAKLDAVWTRQVFRYSSNYASYDPAACNGRGIILVDFDETQEGLQAPTKLIDCGVWNKGTYPQITPEDGGDKLQCRTSWSTGGGGGSGNNLTDIGLMSSLIYTGTVRELVCFCGQPLTAGVPDPTKLRFAAWLGEAGSLNPVTSKIYDVTLTGVNGAHQVGKIRMFRKTDPHLLLSGSSMCYECLEWEVINATASTSRNNPFGLDS